MVKCDRRTRDKENKPSQKSCEQVKVSKDMQQVFCKKEGEGILLGRKSKHQALKGFHHNFLGAEVH